MVSTATRALWLIVSVAALDMAAASAVETFPGDMQQEMAGDRPDSVHAMGDSEAEETGSAAAGDRQGQDGLDRMAESEAGAGAHGDERSEASEALSEEEGQQVDRAFNEFVLKHERDYKHGTPEYEERKVLFKKRLTATRAHNARHGRHWKAATTKFSDRTDAERAAVRGYRRHANMARRGGSILQSSLDGSELPESKDWLHLKSATAIRDQGSCGSCWAIATVSMLEAHYEIYSAKSGPTKEFSPQQTLECTPNPQECGGQGGCQGATVELAMEWIVKNGIATEDQVPYTATDGKCTAAQSGSDSQGDLDTMKDGHGNDAISVLAKQSAAPSNNGGAAIGLMGYHTLTQNQESPLAEALVKFGPVAVSASAGDWYEYESGVFDGCEPDTIVDHAITAFGYGKDAQQGVKYWLIRNSWGSGWGEKGFIRLLRHDDGSTHCGTDSDPSQGLGCKGGPTSVTVCGMCGILYDSVVPYFSGSPGHTLNGTSQLWTDPTLDVLPVDATRDPRFAEPQVENLVDESTMANTAAERAKSRFMADGEVLAIPETTSGKADAGVEEGPGLMRVEAKRHF